MHTRKASIKETGEEVSPAEWERFDDAVAELKAERKRHAAPEPQEGDEQVAKRDGQSIA